jgi:oligopeptide/dipeptide ABC transporter ATP-binding protein
MSAVLEVSDLSVTLDGARIVSDIGFKVRRGEVLGIIGESGSGKTITALSLLGLQPDAAQVKGQVLLEGQDLLALDERELGAKRGRDAGVIFQDSAGNFNPVRSIGSAIQGSITRHRPAEQASARAQAIDALRAVGIGSPEIRIDSYPHQLSGGQRQRAMIALAMINRPRLLIADEPTTALDATVQAQIIALLKEHAGDAALVLITHDFGVAAEMCDRILVLYHGRIVEEAALDALLAGQARHPYTAALLALIPRFDRAHRPQPIPGAPPAATARIEGCSFRPRCARATERCIERPPLETTTGGRFACWHPLS